MVGRFILGMAGFTVRLSGMVEMRWLPPVSIMARGTLSIVVVGRFILGMARFTIHRPNCFVVEIGWLPPTGVMA